MKAFIVGTSTGDNWEICGGSYLVLAESKDEATELAKSDLAKSSWRGEFIETVQEVDLTVTGLICIQEACVE